MPNNKYNILVIDDEQNMRHMLKALLNTHEFQVDTAANGKAALKMVAQQNYDYILCDIKMPHMDGMAFLETAKSCIADSTVIMMSAYGNIDTALEAIKAGAYDFISKPFKTDEVLLTLKKAEEREALRRENRRLKDEIKAVRGESDFGTMVGKSKIMSNLFELARKAASFNTTVLITGESGTGKELIARGLHNYSPRARMPFVAVNCGGIPENLLESEFFGYVKGAFTGADTNKKGLFAEAEGGTLFLDEIGELPLGLQVKLLRVLQEGEIRQVGSSQNNTIDVRILAATAKDLTREIAHGRFREDLFYRLNVMPIPIPPLRERPEDIPLLAHHFLRLINRKLGTNIKAIDPKAMSLLMNHNWPGNVRELENALERAAILADQDTILQENLSLTLKGNVQSCAPEPIFTSLSLKTGKKLLEKHLITKALETTSGNKSKASELLEISYPALLSKIKELDCEE